MKKIFLFLFAITLCAGNLNAEVTLNKTTLPGEWKFVCLDAPYGYIKGSLFLEEKDEKLVGHVKFSDGYKLDLKNIIFSDSIFKSGIYVDYEYVELKAKLVGNKMKGTVDSPEGDLLFTANKVEKK